MSPRGQTAQQQCSIVGPGLCTYERRINAACAPCAWGTARVHLHIDICIFEQLHVRMCAACCIYHFILKNPDTSTPRGLRTSAAGRGPSTPMFVCTLCIWHTCSACHGPGIRSATRDPSGCMSVDFASVLILLSRCALQVGKHVLCGDFQAISSAGRSANLVKDPAIALCATPTGGASDPPGCGR